MNTIKHSILRRATLVVLSAALLPVVAHAGRAEFNYRVGLPSKKNAVEVVIRRNPFQASSEPERPLPVLRDRDDPALKLPALLQGHIRSVIREPHALVLIDGLVTQPGDEVHVGREPLLPKYRVTLKSIEDDRLVFHLTSLDPQQPGQVESVVLLGPSMRKN